MDWTSLIIGIVIGWMIALLIYGFYARLRAADAAVTMPSSDNLGVEAAQQARLQAAEARIAELEAELAGAASTHGAALAAADAEIGRLQAELARAAALVEPAVASVEPAVASLASLDPPELSDLKRVEGIGPKIEEILHNAGIYTFQQLAESTTEALHGMLEAAGERFNLADPGTWAEQARLAAAEQWDELQQLQDRLRAGRA